MRFVEIGLSFSDFSRGLVAASPHASCRRIGPHLSKKKEKKKKINLLVLMCFFSLITGIDSDIFYFLF